MFVSTAWCVRDKKAKHSKSNVYNNLYSHINTKQKKKRRKEKLFHVPKKITKIYKYSTS